jgi:hypothetical protein
MQPGRGRPVRLISDYLTTSIPVYTYPMTSQKKVGYFTKLNPELLAAMNRYKAAVGVPVAQQIERALLEWLGERQEAWPLPEIGGVKKAARKRAATRQRA